VQDHFRFSFDYALMPDIMNAVKKLELAVIHQDFGENGLMDLGVRQSETADKLLKMRASLWKVSVEEAAALDWPPGLKVTPI